MNPFSPELSQPQSKAEPGARRWRVILYNDNRHKFDDVSTWLQDIAGCSAEFAIEICDICQSQGRAVCFQGNKLACQEVSGALRTQGLQVEVDDY